MASTTPNTAPPTAQKRSSSNTRSRAQTPPPRPTTPLRPPSRSSLRSSQTPIQGSYSASSNPLNHLEPAFADLSDGMADLEANFMHLQLMHESLSRFSESFAAFMYGLGVNAFCADFPEQPTGDSFRRAKDNPAMQQQEDGNAMSGNDSSMDPDHTFLTTDTSFVEHPPSTVRKTPPPSRFAKTRGSSATAGTRGSRGGAAASRGGAPTQRGRPSGLARATGRGRGTVR